MERAKSSWLTMKSVMLSARKHMVFQRRICNFYLFVCSSKPIGPNWSSLFDNCRTLTPGHDPVQKVTLIPRGQARGLTWFIPGEDPALISKQQLFARIVGGLGGRVVEEVIFGEPETTTGAAGDLQQITQIARQVRIILTNYVAHA